MTSRSTILFGCRRRHHAPPPPAGVLLDGPALLGGERLGAGLLHMRADRLGGIPERRVGGIDQRLRHHRHRLAVEPPPAELVAERLDEHVADRALQVGPGVVHRHRRDLVDREFGPAQDEAHLRAVAVGENHLPAGFDHLGYMARRERGLGELIGDREMVLVANEGVAADCNHSDPRPVRHHGVPAPPAGRAPAPIVRAPGLRPAAPLFTRASLPARRR